jgi:hypothetical protein
VRSTLRIGVEEGADERQANEGEKRKAERAPADPGARGAKRGREDDAGSDMRDNDTGKETGGKSDGDTGLSRRVRGRDAARRGVKKRVAETEKAWRGLVEEKILGRKDESEARR